MAPPYFDRKTVRHVISNAAFFLSGAKIQHVDPIPAYRLRDSEHVKSLLRTFEDVFGPGSFVKPQLPIMRHDSEQLITNTPEKDLEL